jgi:hypothetical protein
VGVLVATWPIAYGKRKQIRTRDPKDPTRKPKGSRPRHPDKKLSQNGLGLDGRGLSQFCAAFRAKWDGRLRRSPLTL